MRSNRIIIYPKDVQRITGKSGQTCRVLLAKIKKANAKTPEQCVTIYEFAEYLGLPIDEVNAYLKD